MEDNSEFWCGLKALVAKVSMVQIIERKEEEQSNENQDQLEPSNANQDQLIEIYKLQSQLASSISNRRIT